MFGSTKSQVLGMAAAVAALCGGNAVSAQAPDGATAAAGSATMAVLSSTPAGMETSKARLVQGLRNQAALLYATPPSWGRAATFHYFAAVVAGLDGSGAAEDLVSAANLFRFAGERERSCAVLEKAGELALRSGRVSEGDRRYHEAAGLAREDCAAEWDAVFEGLFPPAPAPVTVSAPLIEPVTLALDRAPSAWLGAPPAVLPPPARRAEISIPPAPGPIAVAPPTLELVDLSRWTVAVPALRDPGLPLPPPVARSGGVTGRREQQKDERRNEEGR